ncbi:DENN domain-containing protein 3-like [Ruditapes philippinarum]|uniref:DENN domain-containing protein 3-like n=1 Tax=Ruditapes philippinarum TaxID=129788 RepID=UPI00295A7070|nr:DENN domain-containing protein 3-like [Ruditapes philippinarum]
MLSGDEMRRYIPQCCAIVSHYPYHSTLKECLSCLCPHVEKSLTEMTAFIKEFAYVITHTPVPPAGNLRVNFRLYDLDLILLPPTHPDKPVIDLELHLVFLCFNAEEFLKILSCILVEERIVFLSSNYDLLTMFMESLMHLILPFRWKSKYSTVLPSNKIDYLKTPGTFLYGVHSRHTKDVEKVANLVIVDVDNGKVITTDQNLCKREHTKSKGAKRRIQLPNIPTQIANLFVDKMSQVNRKFALSGTLRPNSFKNSEEHNLEIKKRILDQNKCITSICQELIADLFR